MKKILIVEDTQHAQEAVCALFREQYETVCVSTAVQALERYEADAPDLVLCELHLPGRSGLELQSALTERLKHFIPFVFLGDANAENESLALHAGALDFIAKPYRDDVLLYRVENAMREVDALRQLQGLKSVVETDTMTGLLNKTFAQSTLAELCAKACGVLMMIDVDNFKLVNDLYGHDMGDRVLIRFAEILRGLVRSTDIVGRMGGDEFIVFCRDIRSEQLVQEKCEAINSNLIASAKEFMGDDMGIPLSASVGAVFVPDEGVFFPDLYKKADKALYSSKQNGKHRCTIYRCKDNRGSETASQDGANVFANARRILGERNYRKGAFEIGFESFRTLYRFLVRGIDNYHYDAEFVVFSFEADVSEDTMDAFGSLLRQSLRRSDACTRSGSNQYMVLLPEPIPEHGAVVIRRVLESWKQDPAYRSVTEEHDAVSAFQL